MKVEKLTSVVISSLLAFCISLGSVCCIVTGFALPGVAMGELIFFSAIFSCLCSIAFHSRRGTVILLCTLAFSLGYLFREGHLLLSLESLIYRISTVYHSAYRWGVVYWSQTPPLTLPGQARLIPLAPALQLLAGISAFFVSRTVSLRKISLLAILTSILPLVSCLVVTDTTPQTWCLFLLFAPLVLLLLTQALRRRSTADGNRLALLLALPVLLLTTLLFWAVPRDSYDMQSQKLHQMLSEWFPDLPFVNDDGTISISPQPIRQDRVSLSTVGPKVNLYFSVMDVTSDLGGVVYLRGQSYDRYDGKSWETSNGDLAQFWPTDSRVKPAGTVTVTTRLPSAIQYTPYYLSQHLYASLQQGALPANRDVLTYTYQQYIENTSVIIPRPYDFDDNFFVDAGALEEFLTLPESTRESAVQYLTEHLGDISMLSPQQIADLVENSARYDLNTPRMPGNYTDFAMWFLEESETGYCVHFATAATVLLRAAGFPARYVTGYSVSANPGEQTRVSMDRAHAWVEYWDSSFGWRVLDPTPPDLTEVPDPTEDSIPPLTDPSTAPTEESTLPSATEGPTQPSETLPQHPSETVWDFSWVIPTLRAVSFTAGFLLLIMGQYTLRCRRKHKKFFADTPNARALSLWREIVQITRLLKAEPPESLEILAEKATFSQHTLTAEELLTLRQYLEQCQGGINSLPWRKKWILKLIFAIA